MANLERMKNALCILLIKLTSGQAGLNEDSVKFVSLEGKLTLWNRGETGLRSPFQKSVYQTSNWHVGVLYHDVATAKKKNYLSANSEKSTLGSTVLLKSHRCGLEICS